jgi:site-specific recombinase XerD
MITKTALTTQHDAGSILIPANASKDDKSRIGMFTAWLKTTGQVWTTPDLAAYRDALLITKSPASTSAHLSTIRSAYRRVLRDSAIRDQLFALAADELRRTHQADNPANRKAFVDEHTTRLKNALDPLSAPVKLTTSQDKADSAQIRLTRAQAEQLLNAPGVIPLKALRDTAAIALMLCTGIREAELCALEVADLRQRLNGELALHIRHGKGAKERLIPYGDLSWVLAIVDKWLYAADITTGPVFRSFWKNGRSIRGRLSVRAVERIVGSYPVMIEDKLTTVHPHDLRRTYARSLYLAGMDLVAISQNLGHASTKTTLLYIGELGANLRRAPGVYSFDLAALNKVI